MPSNSSGWMSVGRSSVAPTLLGHAHTRAQVHTHAMISSFESSQYLLPIVYIPLQLPLFDLNDGLLLSTDLAKEIDKLLFPTVLRLVFFLLHNPNPVG